MPNLPALFGSAALALAATAGLTTAASADHGDRYRWNGPEGHFVVSARACPDLREDLRDRRGYGRHDRYDRRGYGHHNSGYRDRRVLTCPARAWEYVPSARERRAGRYGYRLRPTEAYFDPRQGHYHVVTRWGEVPVRIDWRGATRRGHDHNYGHRGYRGTGLNFEFRF